MRRHLALILIPTVVSVISSTAIAQSSSSSTAITVSETPGIPYQETVTGGNDQLKFSVPPPGVLRVIRTINCYARVADFNHFLSAGVSFQTSAGGHATTIFTLPIILQPLANVPPSLTANIAVFAYADNAGQNPIIDASSVTSTDTLSCTISGYDLQM
jgi:hypothetical protein